MENVGSYVLYLGVFATSVYGSWIYSKRDTENILWYQKFFYFMIIALPAILLQGLRYNVGTDYGSYVAFYSAVGRKSEAYLNTYGGEPVFLALIYFIYTISGGNVYVCFLTNAIIMNTLLFLTFDFFRKYENNMSMPVMYLMYYCLCFPYFLNIERQGLACIILWFSMRYVFQRKPLKFSICAICAVLVHNSAFVGLILYPLYVIFANKKWTGFKYLITVAGLLGPILLSIVISSIGKGTMNSKKYAQYIGGSLDMQINVNWVYAILLVIVLCLFLRILREANADCWYVMFLMILMLSSYWMVIFDNIIERLAFYFEIALIYGYAFVFGNLQKKQNKELMNLFLICLMLFHFTFKFYIAGKADIFPYQSVLTAMRG